MIAVTLRGFSDFRRPCGDLADFLGRRRCNVVAILCDGAISSTYENSILTQVYGSQCLSFHCKHISTESVYFCGHNALKNKLLIFSLRYVYR